MTFVDTGWHKYYTCRALIEIPDEEAVMAKAANSASGVEFATAACLMLLAMIGNLV